MLSGNSRKAMLCLAPLLLLALIFVFATGSGCTDTTPPAVDQGPKASDKGASDKGAPDKAVGDTGADEGAGEAGPDEGADEGADDQGADQATDGPSSEAGG